MFSMKKLDLLVVQEQLLGTTGHWPLATGHQALPEHSFADHQKLCRQ